MAGSTRLPFMPEMLKYCGARMMVGKRAHKTCDPALGIGGRKMANTVHLSNIRCNGAAHDGCEAGCLIFWKEAWLKRIECQAGEGEAERRCAPIASRAGCTEDVLHSSIRIPTAAGETEQTLCLPEHADQVRHPAAAVVGCAAVRGGLHLGQCAPVRACDRSAVFDVAHGRRSRRRRRLCDALDLRSVPARDRRRAVSDPALRRAQGNAGAARNARPARSARWFASSRTRTS